MAAPPRAWDERRLRLWLLLFFVALAVPTGILIRQAYSQLKWEAFQRHRVMAEELVRRIDRQLVDWLNTEEARSFADYSFLIAAGDPATRFLQRSPLSDYPVASTVPGLVGYFQIDAQGMLTTPLLPQAGVSPAAYGVSSAELDQRRALHSRIREILSDNQLVPREDGGLARAPGPTATRSAQETLAPHGAQAMDEQPSLDKAEELPDRRPEQESNRPLTELAAQSAFDRLNEARARADKPPPQALGRVEDLELDARYRAQSADQPASVPGDAALLDKRAKRKERVALPEQMRAMTDDSIAARPAEPELRISIFESEIDAFDFSLLDSGHFVLFRRVWRDGQRFIQGAVLESAAFVSGVVESAFRATALSRASDLAVAYRGNILSAFSGQDAAVYLSSTSDLRGALLFQGPLSAPLSDLQLLFSINRLPAGPGGSVITWLAAILALVLCTGCYMIYRLGLKQIRLTRQQQDFVAAVSHELKTPLTSIRMYGEILREGWADEEKKRTYYAYIHDESERLSRLIANVLQLARMTRNELTLDLKAVPVNQLLDGVRSKIASHLERAGFDLSLECDDDAGRTILSIDDDCFTQIVINLVDNAIKFSAGSDHKAIDIRCRRTDSVRFSVRDYGPGIPRDQMKRIFGLFYRSESELTRETTGTGIGLALVRQLTEAMGGTVDVVNRDPGAEFLVTFPIAR